MELQDPVIQQKIQLLQDSGIRLDLDFYVCLATNRDGVDLRPSQRHPVYFRSLYASPSSDEISATIPIDPNPAPRDSMDWANLVLSMLCLTFTAFCAGRILGILSLDTLMLQIKIRSGTDPDDQRHARILLPVVQQRHLVLVSLLLLNFVADETLPLFLNKLLPTWMAVCLYIGGVGGIFFSELIPSALFIGPQQLRLAAMMSPFAYAVIFICYPISYSISKILDYLLQEEDESGNHSNRGELSALVRIQYEGRMAAKRRELKERRLSMSITAVVNTDDQSEVSGFDTSPHG